MRALIVVLALAGCAVRQPVASSPPSPPPAALATPAPDQAPLSPTAAPPGPGPAGPVEVFPRVRVDVAARLVEFDAEVPVYAYASETGPVYLEVLVCTPQTREHESLLLTRARAADVHAALLMIGLRPGAPGGWKWEEKNLIPIPPQGEGVDVRLAPTGPASTETPIGAWVENALDHRPLPADPFLFAGSAFVTRAGREWYAGDADGTLVGLATFGSETLAWARVFSPESSVDDPVWTVNRQVQAPAGTTVIVRLRPAATAPR